MNCNARRRCSTPRCCQRVAAESLELKRTFMANPRRSLNTIEYGFDEPKEKAELS
jgi:hypothetical protein